MLIWQSKYTETRSSTRSWQFDCYRWCDYPSHPASLWCCYCYRDEKKGTAQRKCCLRMFGQSSTWKSSWSGWPFIVRRSRNNVRPFLWFMCFALVLFYKTCFHSIGGQLSLRWSLPSHGSWFRFPFFGGIWLLETCWARPTVRCSWFACEPA